MEGLLLFDFDRTLIDTDALKEEQARRISSITSLSIEQVQRVMHSYIATLTQSYEFSAEEYAQALHQAYNVNPSDILKIYFTDSNYIADFLFPDVLPVLRRLKENNIPVGIFSEAHPGHQRLKIERSGVLEYIDPRRLIIAPHKVRPEVVAELPVGSLLVDDSVRVIDGMLEIAKHLEYIWLNRKTNDKHPSVTTIYSLGELCSLPLLHFD